MPPLECSTPRANHRSNHRSILRIACALWCAALGLAACDDGETLDDDRNIGDIGEPGDAAEQPDAGPDAIFEAPDTAPAGPILNRISPNRGPIEGGTEVLIIGTEFAEGMSVKFGEQPCGNIRIHNENQLSCITPAVDEEKVVQVIGTWPGGARPFRLFQAFTYYYRLEVTDHSPDRGPARGGTEVVVTGAGFTASTSIRFGEVAARDVVVAVSGEMIATAPELDPGVYDLSIQNTNGEIVLEDAFTAFEPLLVDDLSPRWGYTEGGTEVAIAGAGLVVDTAIGFGERFADVVASEVGRTRLRVVAPPAARPGVVDLSLSNVNGEWLEAAAFLYVDRAAADFDFIGVAPDRVPVGGGTEIFVGGSGFDETTTVEIDGTPVDCEVVDPHVLRCVTRRHDRGRVDVVVRRDDDVRARPGAVSYFAPIEIFDVVPRRGAVAGGTVVDVHGSGFAQGVQLFVDGAPMTDVQVVDSTLAYAVTPPGRPGVVAMVATAEDDTSLLPEAYQYFDPIAGIGGVWGEPIDRAVNISVVDAYRGTPIDGARVIVVSLADDVRRVGETDARGQVTISTRELAGPQVITAAKAAYEVATFERVTAENVTMLLRPHQFDGGGGGGRDPIPPSRLSGIVTGLSVLEKPADPDRVLAAFVDTTHTSPANRSSLPWSEPNGVLYEDGRFEIYCRPGELAVIVTAAYVLRDDLDDYFDGRLGYWTMRRKVIPIAMGVQRFVSVSPGERVEGLDLVIDEPMNLEIMVELGNPSGGAPGAPEVYEAWPYIDFGSEGYWEIDAAGVGNTTRLRVKHLPDIGDWDADITWEWTGIAHQRGRNDPVGEVEHPVRGLLNDGWMPYAVAEIRARDITDGLYIGPFVGTPNVTSPRRGERVDANPTIEWTVHPGVDGPTEPPDANVVSITNARGLPMWTYVTPGPVTSYTLPTLPRAVQPAGLSEATMFISIVPFLSDGHFDFADFTYDDLSVWNRGAYSIMRFPFEPPGP